MNPIVYGTILGIILGAGLILAGETIARARRNATRRRHHNFQQAVNAEAQRILAQRELAAFWDKSPETDEEWDRYSELMIQIGLN